MKDVRALILAGGRGTRMKAAIPKVLYPICGKPMISHVIKTVRSVGIKTICVVTGYKSELLKDALKGVKKVKQKKFLGSADAVSQAKSVFKDYKGDILILYGDDPLVKIDTLKTLIDKHKTEGFTLTLLTAVLTNPTGYGRIVRNDNNEIVKIAEEAEASIFEKAIEEINVGAYCVKSKDLFKFLSQVKNNNEKKEYYLTDIISLMNKAGVKIGSVTTPDTDEALGVNSRIELARAEKILSNRACYAYMLEGVTILDPDSTFIKGDVIIGKETMIHPHAIIEDNVKIGRNCIIGPFSRIRNGSILDDNVEIGNFVELARTKVGKNTKIKHFSYLGDAVIGEGVNIGAGTVTANYDGKNKEETHIKDGAFIGSGSILVAPVKIGKNAVTGAGCVVTKNNDVPPNAVVVGVPAAILKKKRGKK